MVNASSNIGEFLWTDNQCRMGLLAAAACIDLSKFNYSEAYSLAEDPNFVPARTRRTLGQLLPSIAAVRGQGDQVFGRGACDAQILLFTCYASAMRDVDRNATVDTPLAKYVEALFRLKWSYAQFCRFMNIPNFDRMG